MKLTIKQLNKLIEAKIESILKSTDPNPADDPSEEEIEEMSVTGAVAGYQTPGAFSGTTDDNIATQAGMTVVGKKEKADPLGAGARTIVRRNFAENKGIKMSKKLTQEEFNKLVEDKIKAKLAEASYEDFKGADDDTPRKRVNKAIAEINSKLYQIERLARHASKLRNEANISADNYWNSTKTKINRIQERLIKLNQTIKNLGA